MNDHFPIALNLTTTIVKFNIGIFSLSIDLAIWVTVFFFMTMQKQVIIISDKIAAQSMAYGIVLIYKFISTNYRWMQHMKVFLKFWREFIAKYRATWSESC